MKAIYFLLIYGLVIVCAGCAVTETVIGKGTALGCAFVMAGLGMVLYIFHLPVEMEKQ